MLSIHGLIRGNNLELGRDADTGGQTKYVVELAKTLAKHSNVERVDLVTRLIEDDSIDNDYSKPVEPMSNNAQIVRIECGEEGYLAKEQLWDSLDTFTDNLINYIRDNELKPDIIHSHYADAGYVGSRVSHYLGIPLVHTGHSLGREKRRRLLYSGMKQSEIESRYNMTRRIEAEEQTLAAADIIITSTEQEIEKQYGVYDYYQPQQMRVVPPGTDLNLFYLPVGNERNSDINKTLSRFLVDPDKPIILALSRPDQRKNIESLIEAYGNSGKLQQLANLVIIAGNRDDISDMDDGAQEVLTNILMLIDKYNLYGKVAYPKHHSPSDVPVLYRLAALSKGVFINPALTEPFGLTLIEAAASGLPIVATEDGGPKDIIKNCKNGFLIDPLDLDDMADKMIKILSEPEEWIKMVDNGQKGVHQHYSWDAHVDNYLSKIYPIIEKTEVIDKKTLSKRPMLYHDRAIFSDLDQSLLGDKNALKKFTQLIRENRKFTSFGIATGRRLDSALKLLRKHEIPQPDILITSLGTEIHYAPNYSRDNAWTEHIDYLWHPKRVKRILTDIPGLTLQSKSEQSSFKVSYFIDTEVAPNIEEINSLLHQNDLTVRLFVSFGQFLDIIPFRASKGFALRWYAERSNTPLEQILAAGGSGADEDMLRGNTLAVVVGNRHDEELSELIDVERIFFADQKYANGILEAIDYYDFFKACEEPTE